MTLAVYHRKRNPPEDAVYVGRPSRWGNPYVIGKHGTREEVLAKFREYAVERMASDSQWLVPLVGKSLVCWCAPLPCHGEVLMELANPVSPPQE